MPSAPKGQPSSTDEQQSARSSPRKKRAWICVCIAFVVVFSVTGILVGWELRVQQFKDLNDSTGTSGARTIDLGVTLVSVDPVASTMVLEWYVGNDSCAKGGPACTDVDIFFDTNLLSNSAGPVANSNNLPANPIFHVNASIYGNPLANTAVFRTNIGLFSDPSAKRGGTLQDYPFDKYFAVLFLFARDSSTNETVGLHKAFTSGIAVGFVAESAHADTNGTIYDAITLSRSGLVKTYVLVIVTGIWVITLIFLVSTTKVIFGYKQDTAVLVVPVTTMFTATSLRGSMPGAPPNFGAIIDFVGILPCLAIMTFCSAITLSYLVLGNPSEDRYDTWLDKRLNMSPYSSSGIDKNNPSQGKHSGTRDKVEVRPAPKGDV